MRRVTIYLLLLILSIMSFEGVWLSSAEARTERTMLKPTFSSADWPEGPIPSNTSHYKTFTFNLDLPPIEDGEYYEMIATLSGVTKYEGSCANYDPGTLPRKEDLLFHPQDYPT